MDSVKGKVLFAFQGQIVESLSDLPVNDYSRLLGQITAWRKKVADEIMKEYLNNHHPNETLEWEWCTRKEEVNK